MGRHVRSFAGHGRQITLSSNPDKVPGDSSQTGGVVGKVEGPWAVDLHHDDPSYLPGKAEVESVPSPSRRSRSRQMGTRFSPMVRVTLLASRPVAAAASAQNVNLDAAALERLPGDDLEGVRGDVRRRRKVRGERGVQLPMPNTRIGRKR